MGQADSHHGSSQRLLVQDAARETDVAAKQQQIQNLLIRVGADAVLLQDPANVAWFTAGADLHRCTTDTSRTSIFVTRDARLFATNAVDSTQIFEREAFGLGFQLKQREWFQPHQELISDLCRARRVISDSGVTDTVGSPERIADLRLPLTDLDVRRLQQLGRVVTHAVEATAHGVRSGMTEADVAGEVSHRLIKRTVTPVRIQVCADGRNERFRHWMYGESPIERYAVISCMARRWGLHVGVCRTVCLGSIPDDLAQAYQKVLLIHATGQYFSRNGSQLGEVWKKVHRIYEKFGLPCEWQRADQADLIGFTPGEHQLYPESPVVLASPSAVYWHPTVGPAMCGDTVLVQNRSAQILTAPRSWPMMTIQVKGRTVPCPGILCVPASPPNSHAAGEEPGGTVQRSLALDEGPVSRLESVWELEVTSDRSVFEEDDKAYSEESVLE
ncbi:MAG: M24 family metallopeptidase [Fuerstiella sp.]|nr:M24 family metallopeptidase [Fuerstiella sp.]